ncbi:Ribosomal RNA large subunit methyltransferase J [Burkholderia sp. 8Y]|nr:Ribosomal RNA large subunit methyltransferase J [Burkholderia sp. 8Y]
MNVAVRRSERPSERVARTLRYNGPLPFFIVFCGSLVMLSYRHAFHAGNHADVLKHAIVVQMLRYLGLKDKPYWYIDTHSGAGVYSLTEGFAVKNAEYESGIARLWDRTDLPPLLADYVDEVKALNPDGALRFYPGSPYLAWRAMREQDRMRLFELHSTEIDVLRHNFRDAGRRAMIYDGDGFEGIKAILPPAPRRALVLIDPSYEDKRDYARTVACLEESLKRFATGTYAVWYPQVARMESQRFADQLKAIQPTGWLHATLTVKAPPADGLGLFGSGMFILNPPYKLASELKQALPYLVDAVGEDAGAAFKLEQRAD